MALPPGIERFVYSHSRDVVNCPSCGRYVGPLEICPYCRKHHKKRLATRLLKYLCPLIALIGILGLREFGKVAGHPRVTVAGLTERSNFAYVRVGGLVAEPPKVFDSGGSDDAGGGTLEFLLDDGTGRIKVKTFEDATRRIVQQGKVPALGDRVELRGNFQVRGETRSIVVGSPDEIALARPETVVKLDAAELAQMPKQELAALARVEVTGRVKAVGNRRDPRFFSAYFTVHGEKGEQGKGTRRSVKVVFPWTMLEMSGDIEPGEELWAGAPEPGQWVTVTGAARYEGKKKYRGWSIYPASTADVRPVAHTEMATGAQDAPRAGAGENHLIKEPR